MNSTRKRILIIMCLVPLFLVFFLLNYSFPGLQNQNTNQRDNTFPVLITVFYEALCPDSKYFLSKQMLPAFKTAPSIMDVKLVPYGKATTRQSDGNISFDCQHGPTECQANMYHACAVDIIKDPLIRLEVISCMIRDNRFPQTAMQKCAKQHSFKNIYLIQKCFDSDHGLELLKLNGETTHALRPAITFIPTVTIDGSQGRQASILKDLLSEVCKVLGDTHKYRSICK